jgi:hypothetical protein
MDIIFKKIRLLILILVVLPLSSTAQEELIGYQPLSLTSLIATPTVDHLKSMSFLGYARINDDDLLYVYPSKEYAETEDTSRSVFIGWLPSFTDQESLKRCNNKYIIVSGVYIYDSEERTKVIEPIHGITDVSVNAVGGKEICYKGDAAIL